MKKYLLSILLIAFGVITKALPHAANFSPLFVISLYLVVHYGLFRGMLFTFAMCLLADGVLSFINHTALFGNWSFFTYSAMLLGLCITQTIFQNNRFKWILQSAALTFFYWAWTNLGSWFYSPIYSHDISGFTLCYELALPFLKWSMLSSLMFSVLIMSLENKSIHHFKTFATLK